MFPPKLQMFIKNLEKVPGIGPKSAQRHGLWFMNQSPENIAAFATSLLEARQSMSKCPKCSNLSQNEEVCKICGNPQRDHKTICVVADPRDVIAIEAAREYKGLYHVLGGVISPLDGIGPGALNIIELQERALTESIKEVILAIPSSVEGKTTALYVASLLRGNPSIKVTQIAYGLSVGTELEYADPSSVAKAFEDRRAIGAD